MENKNRGIQNETKYKTKQKIQEQNNKTKTEYNNKKGLYEITQNKQNNIYREYNNRKQKSKTKKSNG